MKTHRSARLSVLAILLGCVGRERRPPPPTPETADTGTTETSATETQALTSPFHCPDPASESSYADVGLAWELLDPADDDPDRMEGNPVGFADLDGDGDDDLLLAPRSGGLYLQRNQGDRFETTLIWEGWWATTLALADLDGDRDLDVGLGGQDGHMALFENDGDGGFVEITKSSGLGSPIEQGTIRDLAFGDLDLDGDLDLFITYDLYSTSARYAPHHLLLNDSSGRFSDISELLPPDSRTGLGWHARFTDIDLDGDLDLFLSNADQSDWGPNYLIRNDGLDEHGSLILTDITDDCGCGTTFSAMGSSVGDFDHDGWPDLYLTQSGPSVLLLNLGDGGFAEAAHALGATTVPHLGWMSFGSVVYDYDNDADLDIFATTGPMYSQASQNDNQKALQPNVLLHRNDDAFVDVAPVLGLDDDASSRGAAVGLLDDDGFLDLIVGHLGEPWSLYQSRCTRQRALVIDLVGRQSNAFGEGARVVVEADGRVLTTEVSSDPGWGAAQHPRAHIGLGDRQVDSLTVIWPSGTIQSIDVPADVSGRLTVSEP